MEGGDLFRLVLPDSLVTFLLLFSGEAEEEFRALSVEKLSWATVPVAIWAILGGLAGLLLFSGQEWGKSGEWFCNCNR